MAAPADAVFVDGAIHGLGASDRTAMALAVRNGAICRVADTYEVKFLNGIETERIDLGGRPVLPGFYDGYADLLAVGLELERADLSAAADREAAIEALRAEVDVDDEWVLGAGFDDSGWPDGQLLDREALTSVSEEAPVAARRADGDVIVLNEVAAEQLADTGVTVPDDGILTWPETELVWPHVTPDGLKLARKYVRAALEHAAASGVTAVSAVVRLPIVARALYELDRESDLPVRVRMTYWAGPTDGPTPLEAIERLGLVAGAGNSMLQVESVGVTVAAEEDTTVEAVGQQEADPSPPGVPWLAPEAVADFFETASGAGMQVTAHVKDEPALTAVVDAIHGQSAPGIRLLSDVTLTAAVREAVAAAGGTVVFRLDSAPSKPDGSQTVEPQLESGSFAASGVALAIGDCGMKSAPLQAAARFSTGGTAERLSVTEALRMATGAAEHDRLKPGPFAVEQPADFVVLSDSPWETPLSELSVEMTVVAGKIVYRSD